MIQLRNVPDGLHRSLVNEPIVMPTSAEIEERKKAGQSNPADISAEFARRHAADYTRVARAAIEVISKHDLQHLVIADGYNGGTAVISDLFDTESCKAAIPIIQYN